MQLPRPFESPVEFGRQLAVSHAAEAAAPCGRPAEAGDAEVGGSPKENPVER